VRSTALAVQYALESAGAALAPALAGLIAVNASLKVAILGISVTAWMLCALFLAVVALLIPADIKTLRHEMRHRAAEG